MFGSVYHIQEFWFKIVEFSKQTFNKSLPSFTIIQTLNSTIYCKSLTADNYVLQTMTRERENNCPILESLSIKVEQENLC